MQRSFLSLGLNDIFVVLGFLVLIFLQLDGFANDPGVGWHIQDGLWIMSEGKAPYFDPFLASPTPRLWVSNQWLSDLIFGFLYSVGSWPLLSVALLVLYTIIYFGIVYRNCRAVTGLAVPSSIAAFIGFKIGQIHFIVRPVMISFALFSIVYFTALRSVKRREFPLWLPVFFLAWANLHPAFVLGILILIASLPFILSKRNIGIVILSCVATLFTPYTYRLHEGILALGTSDFFMRFHTEWHPLAFTSVEGEITLGLLLFVALLLILNKKRIVESVPEALCFTLFLALSLRSVRFLPFFGIAATPIVARGIGALSLLPWGGYFERALAACSKIELRERTKTTGLTALTLLSVFFFISTLITGSIPLYAGSYGPTRDKFPYGAMEFLVGREAGKAKTIVSDLNWGGFITLKGYPKLKGVIDDRNELLGEAFYLRFYEQMRSDRNWLAYLRELGGDYLLLEISSNLGQEVSRNHHLPLVYSDRVSYLFKVE